MSEVTKYGFSSHPAFAALSARWHDRATHIRTADWLALVTVVTLPWSTSLPGIAVTLWFIALIPVLDLRVFIKSLARPISALPIALFTLAVLGMFWSDAEWSARLYAVHPTAKFLVLPFLFYHFERSSRAHWIPIGFLASCTLLMFMSWLVAFDPSLSLKPDPAERTVFVKNYIDQSQEFALCAVALAYPVIKLLNAKRWAPAVVLVAIALGFISNMAFATVSRTALATIPVMFAVFALLHMRARSIVVACCGCVLLGVVLWSSSPLLRSKVDSIVSDYDQYVVYNNPSSLGTRLEFWRKSLHFFAEAPMFGNGTGSTRGLFEEAAVNQVGAHAQVIGNPHNQTLNVAVQWGFLGIVLLYAMWWAHFAMFRGDGLMAWIGLLVVVQNFLTSLFNSHLFDYHEGWMYVLGVGIAGGAALAAKAHAGADDPSA